ncbi:hypothetical protein [Pseudonocardia sp.]|uniref:hypothetical protein n=1 Tax=Pseudonocardia sp. TaxID=60912 RepID=UPI003D0A7982
MAPDGVGTATATRQRTWAVGLEGAALALIHVHPGHEEAFEDWYAGDHFYSGGVLGPGVLAGGRWYATGHLRAQRFVAPGCRLADPFAGNHLALYWLTVGGIESFFGWVRPQLTALRADGRMFDARTHVNVDGYGSARVLAHRDQARVPAALALDHPFRGLFLTYGEAHDGPAAPGGDLDLPAGSLAVSFRPAAGTLDRRALNSAAGSPGGRFPADGGVVATLLFLPVPPPADRAGCATLAAGLGAAAGAVPLWGGGFLPVVPGARDHLDRMA